MLRTLRFSYSFAARHGDAVAVNVSRGGAYLNLRPFPPVGATISLEVPRLAEEGVILRFLAEVTRRSSEATDAVPGVAVVWLEVFCNKGVRPLSDFLRDSIGFEMSTDAFVARSPKAAAGPVVFDFEDNELREADKKRPRRRSREIPVRDPDAAAPSGDSTSEPRIDPRELAEAAAALRRSIMTTQEIPTLDAKGKVQKRNQRAPSKSRKRPVAEAPDEPESPLAAPHATAPPTGAEPLARTLTPEDVPPGDDWDEVGVGLTVGVSGRHCAGRTSHLGLNGLRMLTEADPPPLGAQVQLRLPLSGPHGYAVLAVQAVVTGLAVGLTESAVRVEFDFAGPEPRESLAAFLEAERRRRA